MRSRAALARAIRTSNELWVARARQICGGTELEFEQRRFLTTANGSMEPARTTFGSARATVASFSGIIVSYEANRSAKSGIDRLDVSRVGGVVRVAALVGIRSSLDDIVACSCASP